jgi:Lrp/AsnC family leucine-responsive transcriptional regulator
VILEKIQSVEPDLSYDLRMAAPARLANSSRKPDFRVRSRLSTIIYQGERYMDAIDRKLIDILQEDASLSYSVLGAKVGLSVSAVNDRVRKLREQGVIQAYRIAVDQNAIGRALTAMVWLRTDPAKGNKKLVKSLIKADEVLECHHMTGRFDFLVKLRLRDTAHLESFVSDTIKEMPGVVEVLPEIALSTAKETMFVPARLETD